MQLSAQLSNQLPTKWRQLIAAQQGLAYYQDLMTEIARQRTLGIEIYPSDSDLFNAFKYVDLDEIKVVVLGQDPYHGKGQAQGLAFSVNQDIKLPPSLVNIYKALNNDIPGFLPPRHGSLTQWAQQGVLLLNTVLTVQHANAHSHAKLGWETFTDNVIAALSKKNQHCVFLLWGAHAQKKGKDIDTHKHLVLKSVHPSPLSAYRGFLNCEHFSMANTWLVQRNVTPINWQIDDVGSFELF